jgi:hypothetical protein
VTLIGRWRQSSSVGWRDNLISSFPRCGHVRRHDDMPLATRSPSGTTRSFVWSSPDIDEMSHALVADGWSRTGRSRTLTFATTESGELSRNGIRIFFSMRSPRSGLRSAFYRSSPTSNRRRLWTRHYRASRAGAAPPQPISWPCSSNTQANANRFVFESAKLAVSRRGHQLRPIELTLPDRARRPAVDRLNRMAQEQRYDIRRRNGRCSSDRQP